MESDDMRCPSRESSGAAGTDALLEAISPLLDDDMTDAEKLSFFSLTLRTRMLVEGRGGRLLTVFDYDAATDSEAVLAVIPLGTGTRPESVVVALSRADRDGAGLEAVGDELAVSDLERLDAVRSCVSDAVGMCTVVTARIFAGVVPDGREAVDFKYYNILAESSFVPSADDDPGSWPFARLVADEIFEEHGFSYLYGGTFAVKGGGADGSRDFSVFWGPDRTLALSFVAGSAEGMPDVSIKSVADHLLTRLCSSARSVAAESFGCEAETVVVSLMRVYALGPGDARVSEESVEYGAWEGGA